MTPAKAYSKVKAAISSGALIRPDACERCGIKPSRTRDGRAAIQAHHHDYSKPLDVEWICAKCHRQETPLPSVMGAPNFGEKNGTSKLTEADVISARRLREKGDTYQSIADRFGVNKRTAMKAIKGEHWAHVAAAPTPPAAPPSPQPVADAAALASWLERFDKQMEGAGYARETRKHIAALMMRMSEKFKYGTPARPTASQASYLSPIKLTASENSPGLWMDEQGTYYEPADALQPVADAWISVDERLPDECKYVAVLYWPYNNRENRQIVGYAEYVEGEFYTHEGDEHHPPSHWCALPDFPIHGALSGNTAAKGE